MAQALDCPICMEVMYMAKISQCGHSVCGQCAMELKGQCPECRKPAFWKPNFFVDRSAEELRGDEYKERARRCKESIDLAAKTLSLNESGLPVEIMQRQGFTDKFVIEFLDVFARAIKSDRKLVDCVDLGDPVSPRFVLIQPGLFGAVHSRWDMPNYLEVTVGGFWCLFCCSKKAPKLVWTAADGQ